MPGTEDQSDYAATLPLAAKVGLVLLAIALAIGSRLLIERFVTGVVIFPLVFPAVALAALLAGWQAGLAVIVGCQLLAWYFLLLPRPPASGVIRVTLAREGDA